MSKKNGFTIIELLVTLGIISIVSFFCIPFVSLLNYQKQDILLNTTCRELLGDLRLSQQKSITEGFIYNVFFNTIENTYMIYSYKDLNSCIYKFKKIPDGIKFDALRSSYSNNKVSFNSRGKPLPYPCTISLVNNIGHYMKITITVGTDYISIKK